MSKEFQWTNDKVRQFANFYRNQQGQPKPWLWGEDLLEHWIHHYKQEWEVIAYKTKYLGEDDIILHRDIGGIWRPVTGSNYYYTLPNDDELKKHGTIYKVKRLSDGEMFSVGDEIHETSELSFPLKSFLLNSAKQLIVNGWYFISDKTKKSKQIDKERIKVELQPISGWVQRIEAIATRVIKKDEYPAIKEAIEKVLNDESGS